MENVRINNLGTLNDTVICDECNSITKSFNGKEVGNSFYCYSCILGIVAYAQNETVDNVINDLFNWEADFIFDMLMKREKIRKEIDEEIESRRKKYGSTS